jgi:hypothetical protein
MATASLRLRQEKLAAETTHQQVTRRRVVTTY